MNKNNTFVSLDSLLEKLNSGEFNEQSYDEFVKRTNNARANAASKTTIIDGITIPYVNRTVDAMSYKSRYEQVKKCLNNIIFINYPDERRIGYDQAISTYLQLCETNKNNFKVVDEQVLKDLEECKSKVAQANASQSPDQFLNGYFNALILIKDVLYKSKIARLAELKNKVNAL